MITVSPVQAGDRDTITAIAALERFFSSPWSSAIIEKELAIPHSQVFGAWGKQENALIGWCCLRMLPPEAELLKIAVHPDAQRTGIGTRLLHKVFTTCEEKKCGTVFLEVRRKNTAALALYHKTGFHQSGLRKRYYVSPPDDGILLAKVIAHTACNTTLSS